MPACIALAVGDGCIFCTSAPPARGLWISLLVECLWLPLAVIYRQGGHRRLPTRRKRFSAQKRSRRACPGKTTVVAKLLLHQRLLHPHQLNRTSTHQSLSVPHGTLRAAVIDPRSICLHEIDDTGTQHWMRSNTSERRNSKHEMQYPRRKNDISSRRLIGKPTRTGVEHETLHENQLQVVLEVVG